MSSFLTRLAAGFIAAIALLAIGSPTAFADDNDGNGGYSHDNDNGGYHHGYVHDWHIGPFEVPGNGWIGWSFDQGA
ncbi:MAG TPA: hypothetical protein VH372_14890 [Actinospica sp.]|jgi:hypothetical protein|nr:hypothetical protein [Actinospica sp.]